ncbi:MAG: leucyl/phenylalanyl-tRNA--protein transferase [Flavobacteriia bacterium]|nr:MAG: leucyl/phenylalanyl-tRNA--protein transferase [Flavobacteriia bacterium]
MEWGRLQSLTEALLSGDNTLTKNVEGRLALLEYAFEEVIMKCRKTRLDKEGTWITHDILEAYQQLHRMGLAHSVEVWSDNQLVGGLYGVDLGHVFCGESMFSLRPNASKYAFIKMVQELQQKRYRLIDCQVHTNHLESLGAELIPRNRFMEILQGQLGTGE